MIKTIRKFLGCDKDSSVYKTKLPYKIEPQDYNINQETLDDYYSYIKLWMKDSIDDTRIHYFDPILVSEWLEYVEAQHKMISDLKEKLNKFETADKNEVRCPLCDSITVQELHGRYFESNSKTIIGGLKRQICDNCNFSFTTPEQLDYNVNRIKSYKENVK